MSSECTSVNGNNYEGTASALLGSVDNPTEVASALTILFPQALGEAIGNAKAGLSSNLVSWVLQDLSGQLGGFTQVCEVKATIAAKAGPG